MITKKNKHKWDQKSRILKSRILKSKKLGIGFQYVNPDMKSYDPVYTIIENPALNKRVLDFKLMRTILKKYHLRECNQWECMKQKPMYIWLNFDENSMHNLKRKYYKTPIYLLNSLDKTESISSKELLHLGMKVQHKAVFFTFLGPASVKYVRRRLMKLSPEAGRCTYIHELLYIGTRP